MEYIIANGILCHHGIKGQKWGIRRYQNPDGTLTSAGRKRRKLSESQKKKIKTAITVGAVAAGTALAAYGAYKLNQKSVKALIESYSDIGNDFFNFANNSYNIAYNHLISAEQDNLKGLKDASDMHSHSADYHIKLAKIDEQIAEDLLDKASSKRFNAKERASAAINILAKGQQNFGQIKRKEIFDLAQARRK